MKDVEKAMRVQDNGRWNKKGKAADSVANSNAQYDWYMPEERGQSHPSIRL